MQSIISWWSSIGHTKKKRKKKGFWFDVKIGRELAVYFPRLSVIIYWNSLFWNAVALGDGFMAQDIWFQNVAESKKGQAVALLVAADRSVINRCRIDGYHNALWAHSLRHLYRDCTISGAINFMFGDAISVLQDCKFIRQKAMCNWLEHSRCCWVLGS